MSWFNKNKKEEELDMPPLPELPDISEFNLPAQLPEVPPGLPSEDLPPLPPIQPPSLPLIKPPAKPFQSKPVPEMRIRSPGFTPTNYPVSSDFRKSELIMRAEPIEGLGIKEIGGISPRTMEMGMEPEFEPKIPKRIEPLYIRLDKFETTVNSIKEIQHKVREIEELLAKTKEIKMREEKELEEWEREIQGIKSRMDFIDKNVFNKLG